MLKLNTKDLVKRATQLADLENSDFISWNENVQMINEAYQKIYQKIINHDDKTYMVKVNLTLPLMNGNSEVHYALPDDFYQLYSLTDVKTGKCVIRKSINEPVNSLRYDIVNNELVIYGNHSLTLQMAYFPVPETLTLKAGDVDVSIPDVVKSASFYDVCDKKIVGISGSLMYLYDVETESLTSRGLGISFSVSGETTKKIIATKYGILVIGTSYSAYYLSYDNFASGSWLSIPNSKFLLDAEKKLYNLVDVAMYEYIDSDTDPILIGQMQEAIESDGLGYVDFVTGDITYVPFGSTTIYQSSVSDGGYEATEYTTLDDTGYILGDYACQNKALRTLDGRLIDSNVVGINKIDAETGYGYTTFNGKIKGIFENTEIEYPNNLFIQLIAYYIAIQYKSKQNADCNGLIALYQGIEEQFYDSIGRDDYQYTRIQNVY